jgi:hypothetical protein
MDSRRNNIGASQTSTAEGRPLTAGMPTTVETPTIVLASTGQQQQRCHKQYGCQQLISFCRNLRKNLSKLQKIIKNAKKTKIAHF